MLLFNYRFYYSIAKVHFFLQTTNFLSKNFSFSCNFVDFSNSSPLIYPLTPYYICKTEKKKYLQENVIKAQTLR